MTSMKEWTRRTLRCMNRPRSLRRLDELSLASLSVRLGTILLTQKGSTTSIRSISVSIVWTSTNMISRSRDTPWNAISEHLPVMRSTEMTESLCSRLMARRTLLTVRISAICQSSSLIIRTLLMIQSPFCSILAVNMIRTGITSLAISPRRRTSRGSRTLKVRRGIATT